MQQHLTTFMNEFLDGREAHRPVTTSLGFIDICNGKHLDAIVLQGVLDDLTRARQGAHPWRLEDDKVFVQSSYKSWWQRFRIKERTARRAINRLRQLELVEREVFHTDGILGPTALFIHVVEPRLALLWTELLEKGVIDRQPPEDELGEL